MNTIKNGWMAAALVALAAAAAVPARAFTRGERLVAGIAAEEAKGRFAGAGALQDKAVTLLPVHGDEDGYLEARLLDAGIQGGLKMVVANDANDARFRRILEEIRWDEDQMRLETVNPDTIDELGHLLSTQVLLESRATKGRLPVHHDRFGKPAGAAGADGEGLAEMEVQLLAYEIKTKRYVWSAIVDATEPSGKKEEGSDEYLIQPAETQWPLNAGVEVAAGAGADREADLLDAYARGRLADLGYRVDSGAEQDDLTLKLEPTCGLFDHTGGWWVYEGELKVSLAVHGGEGRLLGETSLASRGARGLGEVQAHRNLADDMEAQLSGWMKRTLDSGAIGFEAVALEFMLGTPTDRAWDSKTIDSLQKKLAGLDGVRSVRLAEQSEKDGRAVFRVVYERAKMPTGVWNALLAAHPDVVEQLR